MKEDRSLPSHLLPIPKERSKSTLDHLFPDTLRSGQKVVTTVSVHVPLSDSPQIYKELNIIAGSANAGLIYVGDNEVSPSTGFVLPRGGALTFKNVDVSTIYIDASVAGEGVSFGGMV